MPAAVNKSSLLASFSAGQPSPTRSSPRKASSSSNSKLYPTPLSMSPNRPSPTASSTTTTTTTTNLRYPPSFDPHHTSSRYPSGQQYTPYSPYRPGEYGRSERGLGLGSTGTGTTSERTRIERKLFDDEEEQENQQVNGQKENVKDRLLSVDTSTVQKKEGSSPLAPAFEAKMVLRNGASIDLISWLRTNFHHIPPPHTILTPCMPLNGIRHLLLERFPRAPEVEELAKAVTAAFPHSQWDYPTSASSEPPTIRGLVWHGKDVADEDDMEDVKSSVRSASQALASRTRRTSTNVVKTKQLSRSPTQSTLVSPISSSKRHLPDTPARSVLEEFAEIATLAEKTPSSKAKSLPGEVPHPCELGSLGDPFETTAALERSARKRRASQSPDPGHRRRASSSADKLHGLLAAAEAVEGSPITSVLGHGHGHKRRRTIGATSSAREVMGTPRRIRSSRGTMSPPASRMSFLPEIYEDIDFLVPLNDTASAMSPVHSEEDAASTALPRAPTSSTASNSSVVSQNVPIATSTPSHSTGGGGGGRKVNELPTEGDAPGYDCKPPYPYHEMIRYAIENAPDCRLQLNQIYSTIADRFPFFKTLDEKKTAGWQNSIRHNLSLKKMFVRVNKVDGVPDESGGKGGWWTVQPGVPDEGRPGRKAKAKKAKAGMVDGDGDGDGSEQSHSQSFSFEGEGQSQLDGRDRDGSEMIIDGQDQGQSQSKSQQVENGIKLDMNMDVEIPQLEERRQSAQTVEAVEVGHETS